MEPWRLDRISQQTIFWFNATMGNKLWKVTGENFLYNAYSMAADLDADGNMELLLSTIDRSSFPMPYSLLNGMLYSY